jgi:hypothetical protein
LSEENNTSIKSPPVAGHRYGFIYPIVWRILEFVAEHSLYHFLITYLPTKYNKKGSAICSDIYVLSWWVILFGSLVLATQGVAWFVWLVLVVCAYRYIEILSVLLSILVRRFIKHTPRGQGLASGNRTLLLIVLNGLEIFLIFAVFYICLQELWQPIAIFDGPKLGILDSVYYSVVTGTTLGYGDISAVCGISKLFSILEVLTVFLVFVVVLASVASSRPGIPDLEK